MKLLNYDIENLNFLDVNISWFHLLNLLNADYENFSNYLFILDGDIKKDILQYMKRCIPCNFNFNIDEPEKSDILCLPCNQPIEKELFDYVNNLPEDNNLFEDPYLLHNGIVNKRIIENFTNETMNRHPKDKKEKTEFCKHWLRWTSSEVYVYFFKILDQR